MERTPVRFSAEHYLRLDIEGRTELLGGVIYRVSPRNEPHSYAVSVLARLLIRGLGDDYAVRIQDHVAVSDWRGKNAPEIDVAVLRPGFHEPGPTVAEAYAFIEVSDTTYGGRMGDRNYKIPLYVRAGVPAWIVNIATRQVECYTSLDDLALPHGRIAAESETIDLLGVSIPVRDLFGSRRP
jgi:hypothetical protein